MSSNIPTPWIWPPWKPGEDAARAAEDARLRRAALRRSGALQAAVGAAAALLLAFWKPPLAVVVGAIAVALLALALAAPGGYARVAAALERFGRAVGQAMTWLLMPLLFYLLFLPVGLALRTAGKLRLTRGADPARATYWEEPVPGHAWGAGGEEQYRRQF
jgi:hypothetical protein